MGAAHKEKPAVLRTPAECFEDLPGWPYAPHYISELAGFDDLQLHYIDEGSPDAAVTFLCLHGQPSWSYLYRKMIPHFVEAGHRVVAPDLFGFGRSDKPVDEARYTYDFHRQTLIEFVRALDLSNVCLVVQDWGGILGLTLPLEFPEKFTRLIIMNTFLPAGEPGGDGFNAWRSFNRAHQDLDLALLMRRASPGLSEGEARAYAAPFPTSAHKAGVRRFPELVMVADGPTDGIKTSLAARDFWQNQWTGESFMAIGMDDPILGAGPMHFMHGLIRGCPPPLEIDRAGHFVQEWGDIVAPAALANFNLGC